MEILKKYNKEILIKGEKNFPISLETIPDCPEVLYAIGNISLLNQKCISIVGTRKASTFGNDLAYNFANSLSKNGIVVVSGLAFGIDQSAHKGALEFGNTIAVIAGGFKVAINSGNIKIFEKIINSGGLVITEYEDNTPPQSFTFLARNRLIAGLSLATIVVEAPIKSGALNTAMHANRYERLLYAVPYNLNYSKGEGCNYLFKNGAKVLLDISQILDILSVPYEQIQIEELDFKENKIRNIPSEYMGYYEFIKENAPVSEEQIIQFFYKKCVSEITSDLSVMEIDGYIKLIDGFYTL